MRYEITELEKKEIIGKTFGRLTILEFYENLRYMTVKCECSCGKIVDKNWRLVRLGTTQSCGCKRREMIPTHSRKYIDNIDFFRNESSEFFYFLGLLYSDGTLSRKDYSFAIHLQERDKDIIYKLVDLISPNRPIEFKDRLLESRQNSIGFTVNNMAIYSILLSWGLYPNKSSTIVPDERLINNRNFWRGIIDGDGSISITNNRNQPKLTLGGTKDMVEGFRIYCKTITNSSANLYHKKNCNHNNYYTITYDCNHAKVILTELYQETDICIKRKLEKSNDIINNFHYHNR